MDDSDIHRRIIQIILTVREIWARIHRLKGIHVAMGYHMFTVYCSCDHVSQ